MLTCPGKRVSPNVAINYLKPSWSYAVGYIPEPLRALPISWPVVGIIGANRTTLFAPGQLGFPGLLTTCRQIHEEAFNLWLTGNQWLFFVPCVHESNLARFFHFEDACRQAGITAGKLDLILEVGSSGWSAVGTDFQPRLSKETVHWCRRVHSGLSLWDYRCYSEEKATWRVPEMRDKDRTMVTALRLAEKARSLGMSWAACARIVALLFLDDRLDPQNVLDFFSRRGEEIKAAEASAAMAWLIKNDFTVQKWWEAADQLSVSS